MPKEKQSAQNPTLSRTPNSESEPVNAALQHPSCIPERLKCFERIGMSQFPQAALSAESGSPESAYAEALGFGQVATCELAASTNRNLNSREFADLLPFHKSTKNIPVTMNANSSEERVGRTILREL